MTSYAGLSTRGFAMLARDRRREKQTFALPQGAHHQVPSVSIRAHFDVAHAGNSEAT